jgi:hypothetical protein
LSDWADDEAECLCIDKAGKNKLWMDISEALVDVKHIYGLQTTKDGVAVPFDNGWARKTGFVRRVYLQSDAKISLPTATDSTPKDNIWPLLESPFSVLLWHELVGHAIKKLDHPKKRWNTWSYRDSVSANEKVEWITGDPTIAIENEARERLNLKKRRPQYWESDEAWY